MVIDKPALTSALVDGGLDPESARYFVDLMERQQAELATQAEVNRRLDLQGERIADRIAALEQRLEDFKAETNRRFTSLERQIDSLQAQINELRTETKRQFDEARAETKRQIDEVKAETKRQIDEAKAETNRRIDDLRDTVNQRFTLVFWAIGASIAVNSALFGVILARLF